MVIKNFREETKDIETVSRYNGGWLKTVTGLDKSKNNGYSIQGAFVKAGDYKENYQPGLYLDCSKNGSRKNQIWNYHLFKLDEDGFHLLQTVEDGGRTWAVEFWEKIEEELNGNKSEVTAEDIINSLYEKYDEKLIKEVAEKLCEKCDILLKSEYDEKIDYLDDFDFRAFTKKDSKTQTRIANVTNAVEDLLFLDNDKKVTTAQVTKAVRFEDIQMNKEIACIRQILINRGYEMFIALDSDEPLTSEENFKDYDDSEGYLKEEE